MKIVASEYWFALTFSASVGMWSVTVLIRLSIEDPYLYDWIASVSAPVGIPLQPVELLKDYIQVGSYSTLWNNNSGFNKMMKPKS